MRGATRLRAALAAAAAVLLVGTGCVSERDSPAPGGSAPAEDPALARFTGQQLQWGECEQAPGLDCAPVTVPLDYSSPGAGETTVVMARLSGSHRDDRPPLFLNPGGPGGSGVDLLSGAQSFIDRGLRQHFTVMSFDPRGVARSEGIRCLDDAQLDAWRDTSLARVEAEDVEALRQEYREVGQACQRRSTDVLEHMGTAQVAQDMDLLRAVLGAEQTNYLGFSYGTEIGALYAQAFPDRVGRFVLDSAVDPSLDNAQVTTGQARAFEEALRHFLQQCVETDRSCFTDSPEAGLEEIQRILAVPASSTVMAGERRVSAIEAVEGVLGPLYSPGSYSQLNAALSAAQDGDYARLQEISDRNHGRTADGQYRGNSSFAFPAVNCADDDVAGESVKAMSDHASELREVSPTFGPYLGFADAACQGWPVAATGDPQEVSYDGESPILVVGTRHDPATPYPWARSLTQQLGQARLLTYEGWGHVAYTSANSCVTSAVNGFLTEGRLPEEGTVCTSQP